MEAVALLLGAACGGLTVGIAVVVGAVLGGLLSRRSEPQWIYQEPKETPFRHGRPALPELPTFDADASSDPGSWGRSHPRDARTREPGTLRPEQTPPRTHLTERPIWSPDPDAEPTERHDDGGVEETWTMDGIVPRTDPDP